MQIHLWLFAMALSASAAVLQAPATSSSCHWTASPTAMFCKPNRTVYLYGSMDCSDKKMEDLFCPSAVAAQGGPECDAFQLKLVPPECLNQFNDADRKTSLPANFCRWWGEPTKIVKDGNFCLGRGKCGEQDYGRDVFCSAQACDSATSCAYMEQNPVDVQKAYDAYMRMLHNDDGPGLGTGLPAGKVPPPPNGQRRPPRTSP